MVNNNGSASNSVTSDKDELTLDALKCLSNSETFPHKNCFDSSNRKKVYFSGDEN
jgi:hypothetical protein